ncbi:MFS general substrate transporter [Xylariomycetidae sp. FL2044]|nr:MFS general substrate transporter [Xylariomycetidae sp. FL2044]
MTGPTDSLVSATDEGAKGGAGSRVHKSRTWRSYFWDTWDKSPEERAFLFKLDAIVLTFASLGYFVKYLDQVNINSAFVSGMKEDLSLNGNQLNYMTTYWTVTWSVLTILLAKCQTANQIYGLRFFIGLAESTFYPGMQYIIGSWYRKDELAKRSCIFHASGGIGTMFSGYLMASTYRLDGRNGYQGWQWLFIINTIISLPIAIAGFFFFPDVPEITRAFWLSKDEIALAKKRMQLEGRANRGTYTKTKFKKIFTSWHIYALTILYICFNNGSGYGSQPAFSLWLKSEGYDVTAINTYPTIAAAIGVLATFVYAWTSDTIFRGARWPPMLFTGIVNIVIGSSLAAWNIPTGWKWACYLMGNLGGGISGLTFAWAHEICSDDNEERALVVASMNEMAYVFQAWLPLLVWQQVEAPQYRKGFITSVGLGEIESVVVIGAGISGVVAAAHLAKAGFEVTVLERKHIVGGVWHYEAEPDNDPPYPNTLPPDPKLVTTKLDGLSAENASLLHAPPGPCYAGLVCNIPTPVLRSSLLNWPEGSGEFVEQSAVRQWCANPGADATDIEDIARLHKIYDKISFHTSVETVSKSTDSGKWTVKTRRLVRDNNNVTFELREDEYDAVVVASGHYHLPYVPDIPGLSTWKRLYPERVTHSKRYRTPAPFSGKTVLIIGAGASAMDVSKEVIGVGGRAYQSRRSSRFDLRGSEAVEKVAMVSEFLTPAAVAKAAVELEDAEAIPGRVKLEDGQVLENIDFVVVATGYITSYPFLGELQQPSVDFYHAEDKTLITSDGYATHNLHKDVFYIPDPTLAFIGVSHYVSTFSLFDFQARVLARVFAGQAQLPCASRMKEEQRERKAQFKEGDKFHSLLLREDEPSDLRYQIMSPTRPDSRGA